MPSPRLRPLPWWPRFPGRGVWHLAALLVVAIAGARAAEPWQPVVSDLTPDPELVSGTLENGVRYVILPHAFPEDRLSVRMVVAVGSREEREEERGLAHFLEHMAFRGTRQYPRGTLMPALERIGIAPGPDNTAFTYYDHTSYQLELRDAKPETLRQALGVFREFAEGITFDPDLIERERAVVLNEKSFRDTPDSREQDANRIFLWPTARETQRAPIGLENRISRFTRDQFVAFYDAWYRPERIALVVVGDIAGDSARALVEETFASLVARAPARPGPDLGQPAPLSDRPVEIFRDSGINGLGVLLQAAAPEPTEPDTPEWRRGIMHRALALTMFRLRIRQVAQQEEGVMAAPFALLDEPVDDWRRVGFAVSGRIDQWRTLLPTMEQELRRVWEYGFTAEELRQAKAGQRSAYEEAVRTRATRDSAALAATLETSLLYGQVFVTPETARDEMEPIIEATTLEDCLVAFRELWGESPPRVFLGTNSAFQDSADTVRRVFEESRRVKVGPPVEQKAADFAYTDFGSPGELHREQTVAELNLRLAEFDNRVRLNFKPTSYDRDFVSLTVRVGTGRRTMPVRGLDYFANAAFTAGGLGRHSAAEFPAILAGHNVNVAFSVAGDGFVFSARAAREDLLLCLQLITAYLTDAGYRPDLLRDVQSSMSGLYSGLANSPGGAISAQSEYLLSAGDLRFGVPDIDELSSRTYEELAAWLEPEFKTGPIEVSVVGDATWGEVEPAVASTLGALPERQVPSPAANRQVRFVKLEGSRAYTFPSTLRQATFALVVPASDLVDVHRERRCDLLAAVLNERLRVALREELGATYTPSVEFVRNEGFAGFDYFILSADVLPDQLEDLVDVMHLEVARLVEIGIDADLFARVHQTQLRELDDGLRTNGYWLYAVLDGIQGNPELLAAARDLRADYASITAEELHQLAVHYFDLDQAYTFSAIPGLPVEEE